jgi:hypothetical protein
MEKKDEKKTLVTPNQTAFGGKFKIYIPKGSFYVKTLMKLTRKGTRS